MRRQQHGSLVFTLVLLLTGLVLMTTWMTSNLYARYAAAASGEDTGRVASFNVKESGDCFDTDISALVYPGWGKDYSVVITNSSEVSVRCIVTLDNTTENLVMADGTELLQCSLPSDSSFTSMGNNSWYVDLGPNGATGTFAFSLSLKSGIDPVYMGQVDMLKLTVESFQLD